MSISHNYLNISNKIRSDQILKSQPFFPILQLPSFQGCITVFTALAKPPTSQFINASRWYSHIDALLTISWKSYSGEHQSLSRLVYGIKKLQIMCTIVDDLVSVDTMIEEQLTVEPINEFVQSCDIVAFNKICKFLNYL
ncbi:hypothetical protein YC2023_083109 [Brassica napus]|nr:unnamed protein product [Brassica napus]